MDYNLQFKLGSVGGLENAFCSYQLKTNLKKTIAIAQALPTQGASRTEVCLEVFLVSCVELGMSGFSQWWKVKVSMSSSLKNRGETEGYL